MNPAMHPLSPADQSTRHPIEAETGAAAAELLPDESEWTTRWRSSPLQRGASPLTADRPWSDAPPDRGSR